MDWERVGLASEAGGARSDARHIGRCYNRVPVARRRDRLGAGQYLGKQTNIASYSIGSCNAPTVFITEFTGPKFFLLGIEFVAHIILFCST